MFKVRQWEEIKLWVAIENNRVIYAQASVVSDARPKGENVEQSKLLDRLEKLELSLAQVVYNIIRSAHGTDLSALRNDTLMGGCRLIVQTQQFQDAVTALKGSQYELSDWELSTGQVSTPNAKPSN